MKKTETPSHVNTNHKIKELKRRSSYYHSKSTSSIRNYKTKKTRRSSLELCIMTEKGDLHQKMEEPVNSNQNELSNNKTPLIEHKHGDDQANRNLEKVCIHDETFFDVYPPIQTCVVASKKTGEKEKEPDDVKSTNNDKPPHKVRKTRSTRANSKTIIYLPKDALSLVSSFENDLLRIGIGICEKRWLDNVFQIRRNQKLHEELICTIQMITKNVLHCIFNVTANHECLYLVDRHKIEKGCSNGNMTTTTTYSSNNPKIPSYKILSKRNEKKKEEDKRTRIKNGREYLKFRAKSDIVRKYKLINTYEIERILRFFFYSEKSKKVTRYNNLGSKPLNKHLCIDRMTMLTTTATTTSTSTNTTTDIATTTISATTDTRTTSVPSTTLYRDIHDSFYEWSKTHGERISFVIVLTDRLSLFCQSVKRSNIYGYHASCLQCQSEVSSLYGDVSDDQTNSRSAWYSRADDEASLTRQNDGTSIIFSVVLQETLKFYFSDGNRLNFYRERQPLSDPLRRKRISEFSFEEKDTSPCVHRNVDDLETDTDTDSNSIDAETDMNASIDNSIGIINESNTSRSSLLRQTSSPSTSHKFNSRVIKPYDKYAYINTTEICRFIIYGDKRMLIHSLANFDNSTRKKERRRSLFYRKSFCKYTEEKKQVSIINVNKLYNILHMHPVEIWKILITSQGFLTHSVSNEILNDVISRIIKMYLMLLWDPIDVLKNEKT